MRWMQSPSKHQADVCFYNLQQALTELVACRPDYLLQVWCSLSFSQISQQTSGLHETMCYTLLLFNKISFPASKLPDGHMFLSDYNTMITSHDQNALPKLNSPPTPVASQVAQWLRICPPMQGTQVRSVVWEDPTCRGATKPVSHNY